ncbi:hypothetical protein EDD21DRAFT_351210 [Dissophora ornata]|nr:RNA-DNA hybrid ribonuclease [Dissophora ornata]KAI8604146.1 hypothetical protein EDD21DRAFT_351210 [Dissophora ornata]
MPQEYQDVQLNGVLKRVPVKEGGDGQFHVLLGDIIDIFFYFGDRLELRGKPVPFLENECHERLFPIRIASYPGEILTFVQESAPVNQMSSNPALQVPTDNTSPPTRDSSPLPDSDGLSEPVLKELMTTLTTLLSKVDSVQLDVHDLDGKVERVKRRLYLTDTKMEEVLSSQRNAAGVQREILSKMDMMLARTEALLTQTFELHEYTLPRLFIVLPEVAYQGINPALILSSYTHVKFRLFFLCECGGHTSPSGPNYLNHIHIARHEGYEITRPTEFFRKYGPHVLNLLRWLQFGAKLASGIVPPLSAISAIDLPDYLQDGLDQKVSTCIRYLTAYQSSLDLNVPGMDNGGASMNKVNRQQMTMAGDAGSVAGTLDEFVQLEGSDLRRLDSLLKRKDQDRALGNLFKTVDAQGHVKWICLDHYKSTYHQRQDREFELEIKQNHGEYDKRLGVVTAVLSSSEAIETFMDAMTRAGAFNELDVHIRHYMFQDLKTLADSLSKTNISKLTLTCHEYREIMSMGKKKLPAVLKIMAAGKVRYFHFKNIKDLIPARGVTIPKELSAVRSLELTDISLKDGHEMLGMILRACTNLSVLRLKNVPLKYNRLISVLNGLASCSKLNTLAFHNCQLPKEGAAPIAAFLQTCQSITELDLSQNSFLDSGCCQIIEAAADRLESLLLPYTGFGDESAMALERVIGGERLKCLNVYDSIDQLGPEATESFVRLMGRLCSTELVFPRMQEPCDEACANALQGLDARKLEHLEIEGSNCGDQTAVALAKMLSDPAHPCSELATVKVELPSITLAGARTLADSLFGNCQFAKVSFSHSQLFQQGASEAALLKNLFTSACSRLTILKLKDTGMNDEVVSHLCEALQASEPACRLEYLDLTENRLTPAGGAMVLASLQQSQTLRTLRMESCSFGELGSMGSAVQRFLETNRILCRLSISHVNLCELTQGLCRNANTLKAIEVQYVDGEACDVVAFGDFLNSSQNTLLRLVVKHARICDDDRSLEHLCQHLKQNITLIDLEWDYDQGYEADSYVLQRYLDRNRELWRKNVGAKAQDLALAGADPWTTLAICRDSE